MIALLQLLEVATGVGRGACERSSVRTTGKQTLHQVGECPSGAARGAPRDSTPGSTSQQRSSSTRVLRDPLKRVSQFQSQGWKKDLERIFQAYYEYNFTSLKEARWNKIRDKVFDHFFPRQEEWRRIKENDPLQYMPYMEEQFYAATRIRLEGLAGCTVWIKRGSYYHSVVAQRGQLDKCPHLAGIEPTRGPQMTPSESCLVSQRKPDTPATSSGAPATEASAPQGATTDVPAPMETGGAGDGCSWAEQTEDEDDFKRCRPAKRLWSQSRKWENRPTYSFPLQDEEGRCNSAQEIYRHSGQQPPARHNAATMGITYLHPEVLPRDVRSLGNQVLCMITEYHLAGHAQGSSSLSLVLLEAAAELLPPLEKYTGGVGFHGTRDVRVVDRAKTLRIATWLHHLDMAAAEKGQIASQTLEAARHQRGPLVDLLLAPMTGNLTFAEVVGWVLDENRHHEESSLANLQGCRTQIRGELDDLIETRQAESDASTRRRLKREIDLRRKDIESLKVAISHHQSNLGRGKSGDAAPNDDDSSDHGAGKAAESEIAIAPETGDTPSVSAPEQSSDSPPAKSQSHAMEVDDEQGNQPPASPISPADDDLLTGGGVADIEGDLANLTVSSSKNPDGSGPDASA